MKTAFILVLTLCSSFCCIIKDENYSPRMTTELKYILEVTLTFVAGVKQVANVSILLILIQTWLNILLPIFNIVPKLNLVLNAPQKLQLIVTS